MASNAINDVDLRFGAALLRVLAGLLPDLAPQSEQDPDDPRARRAFLMEMLDRNPGVFASEHDVQAMMRLNPDRF